MVIEEWNEEEGNKERIEEKIELEFGQWQARHEMAGGAGRRKMGRNSNKKTQCLLSMYNFPKTNVTITYCTCTNKNSNKIMHLPRATHYLKDTPALTLTLGSSLFHR